MEDAHAHHSREMQLELLLRELLGEATGHQIDASQGTQVPQELAELRDLAQRLQLSTEWVPLPEGREALRRALVTMAVLAESHRTSRVPTHGRPRWRFLVAAAAALILGVYSLGSGLAMNPGSPSSPLYGLRVALEELKVALVPSPVGKAEMLVKAARVRIVEIEAMATSGDARGLRRAADALDGEAGRLHSITARLSPEDRERMASELAVATGMSGTVSPLSGASATVASGTSGMSSADHRAWVSLVARMAARLKADGKLPPGVTVGDLVSRAAREKSKPVGSLEENNNAGSKPVSHPENDGGKGKGKGSGVSSGPAKNEQGASTGGGQGGSAGGGQSGGQGGGPGGGQGGSAGGGQSSGQGGGPGGGQGDSAGDGKSGGQGGRPGGGQGQNGGHGSGTAGGRGSRDSGGNGGRSDGGHSGGGKGRGR